MNRQISKNWRTQDLVSWYLLPSDCDHWRSISSQVKLASVNNIVMSVTCWAVEIWCRGFLVLSLSNCLKNNGFLWKTGNIYCYIRNAQQNNRRTKSIFMEGKSLREVETVIKIAVASLSLVGPGTDVPLYPRDIYSFRPVGCWWATTCVFN